MSETKNKLGLVFAGGGGKGAYQIGVWKALCETGLDKQIKAVSGTSVGALNAALFAQGSLSNAIKVWESIGLFNVVKPHRPTNGLFSSGNLAKMIKGCIDLSWRSVTTGIKCYVTAACKKEDVDSVIGPDDKIDENAKSEYKPRSFLLSDQRLSEHQRLKLLCATSAIPHIFPSQKIEGIKFIDGGVADNVPVAPLHDKEKCSLIIVIHLNDTYTSNDKIVDKDKYNDSTIINIWPQKSQGNFITGTLDFNAKHARRRINEGYSENIAYFRSLAEELNEGRIPETTTFFNGCHELDKNIERMKVDDKNSLMTHSLIFIRDMLTELNTNICSLRDELQCSSFETELNRYMMICHKNKTEEGVLYTRLPCGDRLLRIVVDLYYIAGGRYEIGDAELEVIAEKVGLEESISTAELFSSFSKVELALFTAETCLENINGLSNTAIALQRMNNGVTLSSDNSAMVRTVTVISDLLADIRKIEEHRKGISCTEERVDKAQFKKDTVIAQRDIGKLYSENIERGLSCRSESISAECLDYIKRQCQKFISDHSYNSEDGFGVMSDGRILKWLNISEAFLYHLDSHKGKRRGFVVDSNGIHSFINSDSDERTDTPFAELAEMAEFKKQGHRNAKRIRGKKRNSEEYSDIFSNKYIHTADIVPLLKRISEACWVDLYL